MKISKIYSAAVIMVAALAFTSCNNKKFHINGNITEATDSMLYLENLSLNGPVKIDSVKLGEDGAFAFDENAMDSITPEFYRLRIANQSINLSIDSTETVKVKASYPQMSYKYEVEGSENCSKIKELSIKQMILQNNINAITKSPNMGIDSVDVIVARMLDAYKQDIKVNYIFKEPMKASSYYALFQTIQLGNENSLIFNPRNNKDDVRVFAAVATSWDTYYPGAERGKNLHNIAIEGMKDIRIIENQRAQQQIDASKVSVNGCIDLAMEDSKGQVRRLTDLKGKVVGAQVGTESVKLAQENGASQVKQLDSNAQAFMELKAGTVDAVILDRPVSMYYLNKGADKDVKIVGTPKEGAPMVFAMSKDNEQLQKDVNAALKELKDNGTYDKIHAKWFGASSK